MFPLHTLTPAKLASDFSRLIPGYLPGVETGAFEPLDRRRCWNKTIAQVLTTISNSSSLGRPADKQPFFAPTDQLVISWERHHAPTLVVATAWGDRNEFDRTLRWIETLKCPQKLLVYTCSKWHDLVLDQIRSSLSDYPYHLEGEQYLFMNLLGRERCFHLQVADVCSTGRVSTVSESLKPVSGSPFYWIES